MTIGVGMLTKDGVIIGADTLVSDGLHKGIERKISIVPAGELPVNYPRLLTIAAAGPDPSTTLVINGIRSGIDQLPPDADIHRIRGFIRKKAKDVYATIDKQNYKNWFYLLVAVWIRKEARTRLLLVQATEELFCDEVDRSRSIGAGMSVGQYFMATAQEYFDDTAAAALLSIRAVKACKDRVDGCGGPSDFYILLHSGVLLPLHRQHVAMIEKQMEVTEKNFEKLMLSMFDCETPIFHASLRANALQMENMHDHLCGERDQNAMFRKHLAGLIRAAQPSPQSTTDDQ